MPANGPRWSRARVQAALAIVTNYRAGVRNEDVSREMMDEIVPVLEHMLTVMPEKAPKPEKVKKPRKPKNTDVTEIVADSVTGEPIE